MPSSKLGVPVRKLRGGAVCAAWAAWMLVGGCGGDGAGKGTYTVRLFGFPELERGRILFLKLKPASGAGVLASFQGAVPPAGERTIVLPGVLEDGKAYHVDYFVDVDGDGAYTPPQGQSFADPSWRILLTGSRDGVTDSHAHDGNFIDISPF